jgi:hypothetical protein
VVAVGHLEGLLAGIPEVGVGLAHNAVDVVLHVVVGLEAAQQRRLVVAARLALGSEHIRLAHVVVHLRRGSG